MSSIVLVGDSDVSEDMRVLCKGAPEAMRSLYSSVPDYYDRVYLHHAARGSRVLALGWSHIKNLQVGDVRKLLRTEAEQKLTFAGFLILQCPLKRDSKKVMKELTNSGHNVVMITGDSALTAMDVAHQVSMTRHSRKKGLILQPSKQNSELEWMPAGATATITREGVKPFSLPSLKSLAVEHDLCVTGAALASLVEQSSKEEGGALSKAAQNVLVALCPHVLVFARTAPDQKEQILAALKQAGHGTLMCGDGTNDVGALKQADVGVSIINSPHLEERLREHQKQVKDSSGLSNSAGLRRRKPEPAHNGSRSTKTKLEAMEDELEEESMIVQLGDASIASPFTSKSPSIAATLHIIRQGRCTLVTTLQMFKILALNCLITAYMLSFLHLNGVKQGDQQLTIVGMGIAMCFFFVSRATPMKKLSKLRPPPRLFCGQVLISILGQFVIHLSVLIVGVDACNPFVDRKDPAMEPDAAFAPNVINSVVFLLSMTMQINTFAVNYRGHPFMQSLRENTMLWRSICASHFLILLAATEIFPPVNDMLELAPLPTAEVHGIPFQYFLLMLMIGNTLVVATFEKLVITIFEGSKTVD